MIDTKLVGITAEEMTPDFYGGTGKMEIFYGERKTFRFTDGSGQPVAYKAVTISTGDDAYRQTQQTDADGRAGFDLVSVRHFKYGNSQENDGVTGTPERENYDQYTFNAEGYRPCTVSAAEGRAAAAVILSRCIDTPDTQFRSGPSH
jgi:hypothetical protein